MSSTLDWRTLVRHARRLPPIVPRLGWRTLRALSFPGAIVRWLRDRRAYRTMPGAERLRWRDSDPQLFDRLPASPFDRTTSTRTRGRPTDRRATPRPTRRRRLARRPRRLPHRGDRGHLRRHPAAGGRHRGPRAGRRQRAGRCRSRDRSLESVSLPARRRAHRAGAVRRCARPGLGTRTAAAELQRVLAGRWPAAVLAAGRPAAARTSTRTACTSRGGRAMVPRAGAGWSSRASTTPAPSSAAPLARRARGLTLRVRDVPLHQGRVRLVPPLGSPARASGPSLLALGPAAILGARPPVPGPAVTGLGEVDGGDR